jgi:hypothetical protein
MVATDPQAPSSLKPQRSVAARVALKDGRSIPLFAVVEAARPQVTLISKIVQPSVSRDTSNLDLIDPGELPQDATLIFSVRAQLPATFSHDESIDVATVDGAYTANLTLRNGGMTLANSEVAVATLIPAKVFGTAAFGPLQFRVNAKGVTGNWQPLATLVRLPVLKDIQCPATAELACKLSGSNLFLVDSVSDDPQFSHPVQVPEGFLGSALPVPHPTAGPLYVRLRDDPSVVNPATLVATQLAATPEDLAKSAVRQPVMSGNASADTKAVPPTDTHEAPPTSTPIAPPSPAAPQPR